MVFEDRCPNESRISIQINTNFKHQHDECGEDSRTELIRIFHLKVFQLIEKELTENEDFEQDILELMSQEYLPKNVKEFSDLGEISIQIREEKPVEIKQTDVDKEDLVQEAQHPEQTKLKT